MTISLWHCIIINFTSLVLEGVYDRLSLFKVLLNPKPCIWELAGHTTNNR